MSEAPTRPARTPRTPQQRGVGNAGGAGGKDAAAGPAEETEVKKGRLARLGKKKLIMIVAALLVLGGAAAFFLMPKKSGAAPAPKPGAVEALDSTSVNLAGGHYLRVGIALQLTTTAEAGEGSEGPDGSKAKDLLIATFSGQTVETLNNAEKREKLKKELEKKVEEAYEGQTMGIYFTEFVTQ